MSAASPHIKVSAYPKITVVTPSYNQGEYLEACIDSVLSQGYPNLEYMVLDGGSTDNSKAIVEKYASHLSYFRSHKDAGHYAAVQEGLAKSTGEIMGWLNSDDMFHHKGLFTLAEVFNARNDVEFLTGKRIGFDKEGKLIFFDHSYARRFWRELLLEEDYISKERAPIMQEGTYWRRSLWEKAGGYINTQYSLAADYELWLRFLRYAPLYSVNAKIAGFRKHGETQRSKAHEKEYAAEVNEIIRNECNNWSPVAKSIHKNLLIELPVKERARPEVKKNVRISHIKDSAQPLISILLNDNNESDFFIEAVDSVLSQDDVNVQLIVADKGKTDKQYEKIKQVKEHVSICACDIDETPYVSLQKMIKGSKGLVVSILEADDLLHNGSLKKVSDIFSSHKEVAWLTGLPAGVNAYGNPLWMYRKVPLYSRIKYMFTNYELPPLFTSGTFFSKTLWNYAGSSFDLHYPYAADLELWRRFFRHAVLYSTSDVLAFRRVYPERYSEFYDAHFTHEALRIVEDEVALYNAGKFDSLPDAPQPFL